MDSFDITRLRILPPHEWIVRPCGDGVVIGAWMDQSLRIYKRLFQFTPVPDLSAVDGDRPETP